MISASSKQHSCLVHLLSKCLNSLSQSTAFWNVSTVDIHFQKLLWVYCPGHARVKGNDQADRLAGKQPSQVACFFEDLKCWGAWDTACRHKAQQGHMIVSHRQSPGLRRKSQNAEVLNNLPWNVEKGRPSVRPMLEFNCFKGNARETSEGQIGGEAVLVFLSM